jgi:phage terminase small subunit
MVTKRTLERREPVQTFCTELPEAPEHLKEAGKAIFNEVCKCMFDNGTLAYMFLPTLRRLGELTDREQYLQTRYEELQKKNMLTVGGVRPHAIFKMICTVNDQIVRIHESLGMTPKSRKNGNIPLAGNGNNPNQSRTKANKSRPNSIDSDMDRPTIPIATTG